MKIQILSRFDNSVIFDHDCEENTIKITVSAAIKAGADLRCANLREADLTGADLEDAPLTGADLDGADLRGADMAGAYLGGANLTGADLDGADLRGADMAGAYLGGANLKDANLRGVNFRGSNLRGANLKGANLKGADFDGADLTSAYFIGADFGDEIVNKPPLILSGIKWDVFITEKYLKIGCQRHTIEKWKMFTDNDVAEMHENAIDFWKQWKLLILLMCDAHSEGING